MITNHTDQRKISDDDFYDPDYNELRFAYCEYTGSSSSEQYFFNSGIDQSSDIESYFNKIERLSTIYVSRNIGIVIIADSTFSRNIGTFGGAIAINSPDFQHYDESYVIIQGNTFSNNMAYFSGNAIYIRNTRPDMDYYEICAGFSIWSNDFTENNGLKTGNGGAISAVCDTIDDAGLEDWNSNSAFTTLWIIFDTQWTTLSYMTDLTDYTIEYPIYIFQGVIRESNFTENYAGWAGSAIYLKHISKIAIYGCILAHNGPIKAL